MSNSRISKKEQRRFLRGLKEEKVLATKQINKEESNLDKRLKKYPKTKRFRVKDTIGVPHPYCITARHVTYAANHCCGILGKEAILGAEKNSKATCGICKGRLTYEQHETALLIEVNDKQPDLSKVKGLQKYLLSIKKRCEADGFAGFAFIQGGK